MPSKTGVKKKTKKKALKKAAKKAVRKKTLSRKKTARKAVKKKITKKKTTASATRSKKATIPKKPDMVEPGPPPHPNPPVEEPILAELAIGVVTHYYSHLSVAVVQINQGELRTGDRVHIKGHSTDIAQTVGSMEYEHRHVDTALPGQSVGIKVVDHCREHDILFVVR